MTINEAIRKSGMTKYRIAKISGVPHTTLNDLCSGKSRIEKCSAETLYRLAKALQLPMEALLEDAMHTQRGLADAKTARERSYEYGLPEYLQSDLDAYKDGLKNGSDLLDCLWGELYGSINAAEITDGTITPEHADYLRQKYLWR
ncbi:MAG: helix-turn-helix transcriptional regulator [Clostridia bacterium]|nr:helix-turn-helix transcriptional regulator [Clostridia bacterium]